MSRKRSLPFGVRTNHRRSTSPEYVAHLEVHGARDLARYLARNLLDAADRLTEVSDPKPLVEQIIAAASAWDAVDPHTYHALNLVSIVAGAAASTAPIEQTIPRAMLLASECGFHVSGVPRAAWSRAIAAWGGGRGRPRDGETGQWPALSDLLRQLGVNAAPNVLAAAYRRANKYVKS